jgi:hypothetical protein
MFDQSSQGKINAMSHLSTPSKMPCKTFDLSIYISGCAARCMFGIKGICYVMVNPKEYLQNRINKLQRNHDLLESKYFTSVMINELMEDGNRWFRFFSSGDFPNVEAIQKIMEVCESLKDGERKVNFWIPTSRDDLLTVYLTTGNTIPDNVCIRYSSPDPTLPQLPFQRELFIKNGVTYSATTLDKSKATCHASQERGGKCKTCRDCWDRAHQLTVYLIHGSSAIKRAKDFVKNMLHFGEGTIVP